MRRWLADPRQLRRGGYLLAAIGAASGGLGTFLRDGTDAGSGTYLLDTAAWAAAVVGAVAEARVATLLAAFQPESVRRRGTALFLLGIVTAMLGCVVLSVVGGSSVATAARLAAAALLIAGVWAGLAGSLSLAITVGARYAADRLAALDDD